MSIISTMEHTFRLRGQEYRLSKKQVEDVLHNVNAQRIEKYCVVVNYRPYPPKQALGVALSMLFDHVPVDLTTQDATRILSALGFEIAVADRDEPIKTESERLFEAYLGAAGIPFRFEKALEGSTRKPDYQVIFSDQKLLFDVKEFHATSEDFAPGARGYDAYKPIREKILAARKKFKDLEEHCCCLVLFNGQKPLVDLEWRFIYGAMLGNLGLRVPFDPSRGGFVMERAEHGFVGGGGRMLRYKNGEPVEPQNTTLSAILVLQRLDVGARRFRLSLRKKEYELGRKLDVEEFFQKLREAEGTEEDYGLTRLRIATHENPYARIPLPRGIFCGPYDELYGEKEGRIQRLIAGEQIQRVERAEAS